VGELYVLQNNMLTRVLTPAWDVGINGQHVWATQARNPRNNGPLVRWNGQAWDNYGRDAFEVSVSSSGRPWYTTNGSSGYQIWRMRDAGWERLPGAAVDIAVVDDSTAWAIGTDNFLYRWTDSLGNWQLAGPNISLPGGPPPLRFYRIAIGPLNRPLAVGTDGGIYSARRIWELRSEAPPHYLRAV
jgi:photosystem II stability/assembly factor-like uncharacterized protein